MDAEALKLLGQGSFALALIGLLYLVGMRIVKALDGVTAKLDEHTKTDLAHHAEVKVAVARMEERLDTWAEVTPVEQPKPARGVPTGYYGPRRPTHGDDR